MYTVELKYICCFCGQKVMPDKASSCVVNVMLNIDKSKAQQYDQDFYCHLACFKKYIHIKDKQYLSWLLHQYVSNYINARTFCDEYEDCYLKLDHVNFSECEKKAYNAFFLVVSRFSEFDEDLRKYPEMFFSEQVLRQKALETQTLLDLF